MALSLEWADNLPKPILSDYTFNQSAGLAVSEMSTGRRRARKLPNRARLVNVTFKVSHVEAELFEAALNYTYLGNRFLMQLKLPNVSRMGTVNAVFLSDPRDNCKLVEGDSFRWQYTAKMEVLVNDS